jgi:hypothetical protein
MPVDIVSPCFRVGLTLAEACTVVDGTHFSSEPSLIDYYEEAYSRCGLEFREGYMIREANRTLLFLLKEWNNRGVQLWTIVRDTFDLDPGTEFIVMPVDTFDVMHCAVRYQRDTANQQDYYVDRISADEYFNLPNKLQQGRPVKYWLDRSSRWPRLYPWLVPNEQMTLAVTRIRNLRTPPPGLTGSADVPDRMAAALVAGLAYGLALKRKEARMLLPQLKADYQEQLALAENEDREKAPLTIVPEISWTL